MMHFALLLVSGRSAAWLAHLLWEQRVGGSNPSAPTKKTFAQAEVFLRLEGRGDSKRVWRLPDDVTQSHPRGSTSAARWRSNPSAPTKKTFAQAEVFLRLEGRGDSKRVWRLPDDVTQSHPRGSTSAARWRSNPSVSW